MKISTRRVPELSNRSPRSEHGRDTAPAPSEKRARHAIGNTAQRDVPPPADEGAAGIGAPDGGDWMAERIKPGKESSGS